MNAPLQYQRTPEQASAWRRFQALLELDRIVRKDPSFLSRPSRRQPHTTQTRS